MITGAVKMQNCNENDKCTEKPMKMGWSYICQGQIGGASLNWPILCDLMKYIGMFAHYALACNCDVQNSPQGA